MHFEVPDSFWEDQSLFIYLNILNNPKLLIIDSKTSMDFFRRIGTDRHKFKVEFFLKKLKSHPKLKGDVYVTIKRGTSTQYSGDHKQSSEKKVSMGEDGICLFNNQIISFEALTLFYDADEKTYQ